MSDVKKIGRYIIEAPLGEGAMGSVYRAKDPMIKRVVAIKKIRLEQVSTQEEADEFKQRLFQEAQISGILLHPNIVVVYDVGEEEGLPFIAMEYVEGTTLKDLMKRDGPLDHSKIADLVGQIAKGLQYAHEHNIIHRDIKPQNVMVSNGGEAKIMDFGIAKFIDTHMTKTGIFLGTPAYSSPEQIKGEDVDYRSDIFSLGVLAHELLTHLPPFPGESINTILYNVAHGLPEIHDSLKDIANGGLTLESVFFKVLDKDPAKRYQSATEFSAHFQFALGHADSLPGTQATQAVPAPDMPGTPGHPITPPPGPPGDWNQPTVRMPNQPPLASQDQMAAPAPPGTRRTDSGYDASTVSDSAPSALKKPQPGLSRWVILACVLGVLAIGTVATLWAIKRIPNGGDKEPVPPETRQTVEFRSEPPQAAVYVDGQHIGDTPFTREFEEDDYDLTVRLEGHREITQALAIPLDEPIVSFALKPTDAATGERESTDEDSREQPDEPVDDGPSHEAETESTVTDPVIATPSASEIDQRDWQKAQTANTERAYRQYLSNHPQGFYAPDARGRIIRLRVRKDYLRAMKSGDESSLQSFLDRHPTSQYADEVRSKLAEVRFSEKYQAALKATSPQELDAFLKTNLHRLSDDQVDGIRAAQENLAFQKAIKSNDAAALKRFLDAYKGINQEHTTQIQAKCDAIKTERQSFLRDHIQFPEVKKKTRIWGKRDFVVDYELTQAPPFRLMETSIAWRMGDQPEQTSILRRNGPSLNGTIPNEFLSSGTLSFSLILKDVDGLAYRFPAQETHISN